MTIDDAKFMYALPYYFAIFCRPGAAACEFNMKLCGTQDDVPACTDPVTGVSFPCITVRTGGSVQKETHLPVKPINKPAEKEFP